MNKLYGFTYPPMFLIFLEASQGLISLMSNNECNLFFSGKISG